MQKIQIVAVGIMVALVATITGGSIAFFSAQTGTINNVFTIGDVEVELDEGKFNPKTGETDTNTRTNKNNYGRLAIGSSVKSDLKVKVPDGSSDSWVFVFVSITKWKSLAMMYAQKNGGYNIDFNDIEGSGQAFARNLVSMYFDDVDWRYWRVMNVEDIAYDIFASPTPNALTIVFGSDDKVSAGDVYTLYSSIKLPGNIGSADLSKVKNFTTETGSFKQTVVARSIQSSFLTEGEMDKDSERMFAYQMLRESLGI